MVAENCRTKKENRHTKKRLSLQINERKMNIIKIENELNSFLVGFVHNLLPRRYHEPYIYRGGGGGPLFQLSSVTPKRQKVMKIKFSHFNFTVFRVILHILTIFIVIICCNGYLPSNNSHHFFSWKDKET